jgi:hypothetical protein
MPDGHFLATPQAPAMDDQFGTHTVTPTVSGRNSPTV